MSSNPTLDRFHTACTVPGTWNAGVDGDTRHTGEGYHTWRKLLASLNDYSSGSPRATNASARDQGGRDDCSAAVDRGGSTVAVQLMTGRLLAAIATPQGRYLLRGVREFNGFDGRTVLNRDAVLGWRQNYVPDDSHKTHVHIGFLRDTCEGWDVVSDALSVINGTANLATQSGTATPITSEEDELNAQQDAQLTEILTRLQLLTVLNDPARDPLEPISAAVAGARVQTVDGEALLGVLTKELQSNSRAAVLTAAGRLDPTAVAQALAPLINAQTGASADDIAKATVDLLVARAAN